LKIQEYMEKLNSSWSLVNLNDLTKAVHRVQSGLKSGNKIFIVGNGGSSSTASHFVTDWVKGNRETNGVLGSVFCLSDNMPMISAISNDIAFDQIFAYQIRSYAGPSDLLVCVTGSGSSQNIVNACKEARSIGLEIVTLTGFDGGETLNFADYSFHCPVDDMQIVEDMHLSFGHLVIRCQS
jgi:D-sedoheptulose 7-phosphate isomerase